MSLTNLGLTIVAIVAAVAAVFAIFRGIDQRAAPPIVIEDAASSLPLVVEVRGAVATPGVYELAADARLQDAIAAGGGFRPDADLSTVNLARRLRDGETIVVAAIVDPNDAPASAVDASDPAGDAGAGRININTASAAELDLLPGVGEVTARRIIEFREQNGPYRSLDDLIHVQGISTRTIDELRDFATTSP